MNDDIMIEINVRFNQSNLQGAPHVVVTCEFETEVRNLIIYIKIMHIPAGTPL